FRSPAALRLHSARLPRSTDPASGELPSTGGGGAALPLRPFHRQADGGPRPAGRGWLGPQEHTRPNASGNLNWLSGRLGKEQPGPGQAGRADPWGPAPEPAEDVPLLRPGALVPAMPRPGAGGGPT